MGACPPSGSTWLTHQRPECCQRHAHGLLCLPGSPSADSADERLRSREDNLPCCRVHECPPFAQRRDSESLGSNARLPDTCACLARCVASWEVGMFTAIKTVTELFLILTLHWKKPNLVTWYNNCFLTSQTELFAMAAPDSTFYARSAFGP